MGFKMLTNKAFALGLFVFASYLLESTGFLSPEDRVNQPRRYEYFRNKGRMVFGVVGVSLIFALVILGGELFQPRILVSAFSAFLLLFCYSVFRWKELGILKPLIVSLAWIVSVVGFLEGESLPSWMMIVGLFLLLVLDSLWLDVRDRKGDQAYGINIKLIKQRPYPVLLGLHGLFALWLILFPFEFSNWLLGASLALALCGWSGRWPISRWSYGLLIPLWSYGLILMACIKSR